MVEQVGEGNKILDNQQKLLFWQKMKSLDNNKEQQSQRGKVKEFGLGEAAKACKAQIKAQTSKVTNVYILIEHLFIPVFRRVIADVCPSCTTKSTLKRKAIDKSNQKKANKQAKVSKN